MIIDVQCAFCGTATIPLEVHDSALKGMTEVEIWTAVINRLVQKTDWRPRQLEERRCAICPNCIAKEAQPPGPIAPYVASDVCPKCKVGRLNAVFCKGASLCPDTRQHLHRACGHCKFASVQQCADTHVEPEPRQMRWARNLVTLEAL